jgi:hypothetical protein
VRHHLARARGTPPHFDRTPVRRGRVGLKRLEGRLLRRKTDREALGGNARGSRQTIRRFLFGEDPPHVSAAEALDGAGDIRHAHAVDADLNARHCVCVQSRAAPRDAQSAQLQAGRQIEDLMNAPSSRELRVIRGQRSNKVSG